MSSPVSILFIYLFNIEYGVIYTAAIPVETTKLTTKIPIELWLQQTVPENATERKMYNIQFPFLFGSSVTK